MVARLASCYPVISVCIETIQKQDVIEGPLQRSVHEKAAKAVNHGSKDAHGNSPEDEPVLHPES